MQLSEMTWPAVDALDRKTPVLIPIAALEQHGRHMPVFTDSLLCGEVTRRIDAALSDHILMTPLMWLGNSEHHLDFPGTMSASPRVYLDLLKDMVENFLFHGFKRIVLLNGHGGNMIPSQQALFEIRQERRKENDLLLITTTYWTLGDPPQDPQESIFQRQMGHACEWETSMIMRIRPELVVGDPGDVADVPWGTAFLPGNRAWTMADRSEPGHVGYPQYASAEKGEFLLQAMSQNAINYLQRVIDWDGVTWDA